MTLLDNRSSRIFTVVEILEQNRWVVVLVSERHRKVIETCSKVIQMILDLHQELCKFVEVCECLTSPSLLDCYPFTALPDNDLFDMHDVARSMLLRHEFILDRKEGRERLQTEEAVPFEPFYLLSPSSVWQLFDSSKAEQPVPGPLLQEVRRHCHQFQLKPKDHKELRERLNGLSIFTGRNPLVSSVAVYCSMWW